MRNQFSFIKSPLVSSLNHAIQLMPGLKQVEVIYQNRLNSKVLITYRLHTDNKEEVQEISPLDESMIRFYKSSISLAWLQNEDIPYHKSENTIKAQDIFTELDKNILLVPFKSMSHFQSPLYLFYFRKNASELGPVSSNNILDTSHKQLLGRMIQNSMKSFLNQIYENKEIMIEYNKRVTAMIRQKDLEIEQLTNQLRHYERNLERNFESILSQIVEPGEKIVLSEKTKELLYPYSNKPDMLKNILLSALHFARTYHLGDNGSVIELKAEYFDLSELSQVEIITDSYKSSDADLYSSHTKSYQFLDALEKAAKDLLNSGLKITSMNVGKTMNQPVTAAAISDKLKNHAYKIHLLLKQYPEKWPIIRNQFRPVINIQEKQSIERYAS